MKKIVIFVLCICLCGCTLKPTIMEDFKGKTKNEAERYAKEKKLSFVSKDIYSNEEKGTIIKQSIKPGIKIKENDKLVIEVSLGKLDDKTYVQNKVNESGNVPIMMYHGIQNKKSTETNYTGGNVDKDGYQRTAEAFRSDLEMYYEKGYRMISLKDYMKEKVQVPLGKSPLILTFDDGLENNIKVTGLDDEGNIIIDPNSAIGILEEFKKKYKDFNVTATFFVNNALFNQKGYNEKILEWMIENGYDIGNHTYSHPDFTKITKENAIMQVGSVYQMLEAVIPGKYINVVALPFGSPYKKTHGNFASILDGTYKDISYHTEGTLRVGWESNSSPHVKEFDKTFMKRIRAYDNNGKDFDIAYNFKLLEKNRFVSDGNVKTITIPKKDESKITQNNSLEIITYLS